MTTITIHTTPSADITASIERVKLQLAEHVKNGWVVTPDLFPNITPEEWKRMTTAEWVLVSEKPTRRFMVTREWLEDSRVPIETIFGFPCRCELIEDEAEENQRAMDAFWAERPTT